MNKRYHGAIEDLWNWNWNWYWGLFNDPDNGVKFAVWSSTIAAIIFCIGLVYKLAVNRLQKVKVKAEILYEKNILMLGFQTQSLLIGCTIVNATNKAIFIEKPNIKPSKLIGRYKEYTPNNNPFVKQRKFPSKMEPGEKIGIEYHIDLIYPYVPQKGYIKFVVRTTTGKKAFSNKLMREDIEFHMSVIATKPIK